MRYYLGILTERIELGIYGSIVALIIPKGQRYTESSLGTWPVMYEMTVLINH